MKKSLFMIILTSLTLFCLSGCLKKVGNDSTEYTPISEFRKPYEKMKKAGETQKGDYDLENTVRILNGLELAQSQSEDFLSFMEYMAKQDYTGVPQEVIDAKTKIFPVLQDLFELQKQYDDINLWNGLVRNLTNQYCIDSQELYANGKLTKLAPLLIADPNMVLGIEAIGGAAKVSEAAWDTYLKNEKMKGTLQKKMNEIKLEYIDYLEDITPLYMKYMKEWDRLCLLKDKAYIDLYEGQPMESYNGAVEILSKYPNNREAMLLKAMALVSMSQKHPEKHLLGFQTQEISTRDTTAQAFILEAKATLQQYLDMYPEHSAPALMIQGMIQLYEGQQQQAFSTFTQAAVEYPRQAAQLSDMLDSYRVRTYLTNTVEGTHLLQLYQSTMEGGGLFSPNLIKAMYYEQNGDLEASKEEIFKHFFRRGNQGVYDCLMLDMQFCEENLFSSFKQLLPEGSYIDVKIKPSSKMLGLQKEDSKINVTIVNRSDKDLENLRVFLCVHYTDMYNKENYVVKVPTINRLVAYDKIELKDIELNYYNKKFTDITRIRAIAMTDNSVCWVDNVLNEEDNIDYNEAHHINWSNLAKKIDPRKQESMEAYMRSVNQNSQGIMKAIKETSSLSIEDSKKTAILKLDLPRILVFMDPTFYMEQTIAPDVNNIKGSFIHLEFKQDKPLAGEQKLYMISDYLSCLMTIHVEGNLAAIIKVEPIGATK